MTLSKFQGKLKKLLANLFIPGLFLFWTQTIHGQTQREYDFQYWFDVKAGVRLSERFQLGGEGGYRHGGDAELLGLGWSTLYGRSELKYTLTPIWTVQGGFAVFYRVSKDIPDNYELRPWIGSQLKWPRFGSITLSHNIRLEEQFFRFRTERVPFHLTRFRYQIGTTFPIYGERGKAKSYYLPVKWEFFRYFEESSTKKDRVAAGLGYFFTDSFQMEIGYTADMLRSPLSDSLNRVEHMIRIQLLF